MAEITKEQLLQAFVQGAKWWEYQQTGFTMWQSDQKLAYIMAECRLAAGILGKTIDDTIDDRETTNGKDAQK